MATVPGTPMNGDGNGATRYGDSLIPKEMLPTHGDLLNGGRSDAPDGQVR